MKIGDKVRCIEESLDSCKGNYITNGKIYSILRINFDEDMIEIDKDDGHKGFVFKKRFEKVTENELIEQSLNVQRDKDLGNRLQKAESIIKEYIEYKRLNKQQWSHELQKYVEEYCDINFTKE